MALFVIRQSLVAPTGPRPIYLRPSQDDETPALLMKIGELPLKEHNTYERIHQ